MWRVETHLSAATNGGATAGKVVKKGVSRSADGGKVKWTKRDNVRRDVGEKLMQMEKKRLFTFQFTAVAVKH